MKTYSLPLVERTCEHCGKDFQFQPRGGRYRKYCRGSCKNMHYHQGAKGRITKQLADRRWHYSERGQAYRSEYATTVDRILAQRRYRKLGAWGGNKFRRMELDGGQCTICQFESVPEALQISHVVPRSKGGTHDIENLRTVCANCHAFITSWQKIFLHHKDVDYDWRVMYEEVEEELRARYANYKGGKKKK